MRPDEFYDKESIPQPLEARSLGTAEAKKSDVALNETREGGSHHKTAKHSLLLGFNNPTHTKGRKRCTDIMS